MPKLQYNTRDAGGNDIVKEVEVKQFKPHPVEFQCPICGQSGRNLTDKNQTNV